MAEIVDFGLQKHKIKMDSRYFDNVLSVVAGDTGRRIEVQLLDTNGMVQNTTGLNLRLNAVVEGKATYTDSTLVDAATGKYQLDLSNGMFLAPGNWQFQWQITDSAGKKLHSFAFTGNVGKNISEGGNQASNFYLNLEDLKAMQEDLVNGTFDSEALEMNISEKLTNLESEYAPKLTEVTAQLAQTVDEVNKAVSEVTVDSEVILARGGKTTLGVRLGETDGRITGIEEDVVAKANRKQEEWITPTLLNGWTEVPNYPARYMKDTLGFVRMKGLLENGVVGTSAFKLPSGYIPSSISSYVVYSFSSNFGVVRISADGNMLISSKSSAYIGLDSITFKAER